MKYLPTILVALFVVGLLLAPAKTGDFVSSSVSAGLHAVSVAASHFTAGAGK